MRDMVKVRGGAPNRYRAPDLRYGRSQFDMSKTHKTMFDASYLIPYYIQEIVPGDTMVLKLNALCRIFSPLDAPIMDNITLDIDFFFVPKRLCWTNWKYFLGEHDAAGAQDTDFTIPVCSDTTSPVAPGSMANYLGLPLGITLSTDKDISCLPFRALYLIYRDWYRDQNLTDEQSIDLGNGPDSNTYGLAGFLHTSSKKPDYFTTALPYLQKGDPSLVALTGTLDVKADSGSGANPSILIPSLSEYRELDADLSRVDFSTTQDVDGSEKLYVDLSDVSSLSINALREAAAIQRHLEIQARGGTRYVEVIHSHFGVDVPDYTAQRPEYLGGGKGYINVSPVANTSATATEDQGQLSGVGAGRLSARISQSFVEHGYVIGLLRARGDITYQQGIDRMWRRSTKYDFLWPEFSNLGEQPILNSELFVSGTAATDDAVFGYQERFADYRYAKSLVTGKLASDASGSLDYWHLAEDFASTPTLNTTFIQDATPMSRVTTVDTEPDFMIDGRFDVKMARILPVRPSPSLAPARF